MRFKYKVLSSVDCENLNYLAVFSKRYYFTYLLQSAAEQRAGYPGGKAP